MVTKVKALSVLVLSALLLGGLPLTWLYGADDDPAHSSSQDQAVSASIQFILVHIERETLDQLMGELDVETLDSIPLEELGQCVRAKDGARIVSQTGLAVVSGYEAKMTVVENHFHNAKNPNEGAVEEAERKTKVSVLIEAKRVDGHKLGARFVYDRSVVEETNFMDEQEEEEGTEQTFDVSSGILLRAGQMHVAGANMSEDMAVVLLIKAEF